MTHPLDSTARTYTEFFSRHLIGLCWYEGPANDTGEFTQKPTFRFASGFLLEIEERNCLVTAGHVLIKLRERLQETGHIIKHPSLIDVWSPRSTFKERIPFDFTKAETLFCEFEPNHGVDIALIELPCVYQNLLSQTIKPFTHERWIHQHKVKFDFYAILGFPGEIVVEEKNNNNMIWLL